MRNGWPDPHYIAAHWNWMQLLDLAEGLAEMLQGSTTTETRRGRSVGDATPEYLQSIANYIGS